MERFGHKDVYRRFDNANSKIKAQFVIAYMKKDTKMMTIKFGGDTKCTELKFDRKLEEYVISECEEPRAVDDEQQTPPAGEKPGYRPVTVFDVIVNQTATESPDGTRPIAHRIWNDQFICRLAVNTPWFSYNTPIAWSVVTLTKAGSLSCNSHSGLCPCVAAASWLLNCESKLTCGMVGRLWDAKQAQPHEEVGNGPSLLNDHRDMDISEVERAYLDFQLTFCRWERPLMHAVARKHVHSPSRVADMLHKHEGRYTLGYFPDQDFTQMCRCGRQVSAADYVGFWGQFGKEQRTQECWLSGLGGGHAACGLVL